MLQLMSFTIISIKVYYRIRYLIILLLNIAYLTILLSNVTCEYRDSENSSLPLQIFFAALLAVAAARPDKPSRGYSAPPAPAPSYSAPRDDSYEVIEIIKDDRVYPGEGGQFSTDTETANGIQVSQSGYGSGPDGAVEKQGSVRFTLPNGEDFELTYVADADGGYQPESSYLPVAPAFPHPIPQFVLDQIEKAAREDEEAARSGSSRSYEAPPAPSRGYN